MPSALELIRRVLLVVGEAAFLYLASRLLFEGVLRAAWGGSPARRWLVGILRAPGNILHEASHALGYLIAGFRVKRVVPFFLDREGRGYCRPGTRWAPWAVPWLATGFAALMPLLTGAVALWALSQALDVPEDPSALALDGDWRRVVTILLEMDYHSWRTWAFLYLALSIGAELAPSDIDLERSLPALAAGAAVTIGVIVAFARLEALAPYRHGFDLHLGWGLSWVSSILDFGIMALAVVGIPALILAWPLRGR
ncbi:MAG: hypothetical protein GX131_08885 [candidate division WS1 bacterium]|jgi:hypothetical protein|nr:hypothetical protein [candidate division WS1 bacterium]